MDTHLKCLNPAGNLRAHIAKPMMPSGLALELNAHVFAPLPGA